MGFRSPTGGQLSDNLTPPGVILVGCLHIYSHIQLYNQESYLKM
jgi:hypothetical protein